MVRAAENPRLCESEEIFVRKHLNQSAVLLLLITQVASFISPGVGNAQVRGVYTPGLNATNLRVIPEPEFTYSNIFQ